MRTVDASQASLPTEETFTQLEKVKGDQ